MKYLIELDEADLNKVGNALAQRPYVEVFRLISSIDEQVKAQQAVEPKDQKNP